VIVSGCLLGQLSQFGRPQERPPQGFESRPTITVVPGNSAEPAGSMEKPALGTNASTPAQSAATSTVAKNMIAEALGPRQLSTLVGQPLGLGTALAAVSDRRQQLEVAHAYWRLVETLADYHYALDYEKRLERLVIERHEGESLLRAARASATAAARESELAAVTAQHDLAAAAQMAASASLPVPADQPHTGGYRTSFSELFAKRPAPPRARMLDQTLPIRRRAIDARAAAVEAAHQAASAAADKYRSDRAPMSEALVTADELRRQQRAFVGAVCRYNSDIADYALSVAPQGVKGQSLLGMLIGSGRDTVRPMSFEEEAGASGRSGAVVPAYPAPTSVPLPGSTAPALAPPWPAVPGGAGLTPAGTDPSLLPVPKQPATPALPGRRIPSAVPVRTVPVSPETRLDTLPQPLRLSEMPMPGRPTPAAPETRPNDNHDAPPGDPPPRPLVPVAPHTSNRPLGDPYGRWQVAADALYSSLWDLTPAAQAHELTTTLHGDRNLPPDISASVSLEEALGKQIGTDRRALVESYWLARQRAAEYQLYLQQVELLQGLDALASAQGASTHREPALRRRALELAMASAVLEAQIALAEADYDLASRMGRPENSPLAAPKTAPYCGPYRLNLEAQSPEIVKSWPVRRLAAVIPGLYKTLEHRAAAVVQADGLRAKYIERYSKEEIGSDPVVDVINRQASETLAFLSTLTDYNQAIAQFAVAVIPANTPNATLLAVLGAK
jgi:hypothetical protein